MTLQFFRKPVLLMLLCVLIPSRLQFASAASQCNDGETEIDCGPCADCAFCAKHPLPSVEKRIAKEVAEEDALWSDFVVAALVAENDAESAVASGVSVDAANVIRSSKAPKPKDADDGMDWKTDVCGHASIKKRGCEALNCIWVPELDPSCYVVKNGQDPLEEEEEEVNFSLSNIFKARIDV